MDQSLESPLVSVIIPVFNGSNYLTEAVESVFAQTYTPIELIIVDDGSTDNTWELIQSFGSKTCAIHQENQGVAAALNTGIRSSHGDLIAWLSHDDLFLPEKIALQVKFLKAHPEFGACYTDFEIIDSAGERLSIYHAPWFPSSELPRSFLRDMHINGSTVLLRRSCFEKAGGFDERLAHTQDLEMWLRLAAFSEIGHLPEVLIKFRSHAEQGSLDFTLQIQEEQALFLELYERLGPSRFFPELEKFSDPQRKTAEAHIRLADELGRYRHWYRFAHERYRLSDQAYPNGKARWKAAMAQLQMYLLGDEEDTLMIAKRSRILLGLGQRQLAGRLSRDFFLRHPLRVDVLLTWLASGVSPQVLTPLRKLKRRMIS